MLNWLLISIALLSSSIHYLFPNENAEALGEYETSQGVPQLYKVRPIYLPGPLLSLNQCCGALLLEVCSGDLWHWHCLGDS